LQVLFSAVELGIFEALPSAVGSDNSGDDEGVTAAVLSVTLGTDEDALTRLLDACVGLGMLAHKGGDSPSRYRHTATSATFLTAGGNESMVGYIHHSQKLLYPLWGDLAGAVREGSNRWHSVFGRDSADVFASVYSSKADLDRFVASMHSFGSASSPLVVTAYDLGRFRHLVDVGGGTGHLAAAATTAWPGLAATVLELPAVTASTREYIANMGATDRVSVAEVDFFADSVWPLPRDADIISFGRILHDWGETDCELILRRACAHLPIGGGVLLAEMLLDEDKRGPVSAQLQSLNMLVQTKGKERSGSE